MSEHEFTDITFVSAWVTPLLSIPLIAIVYIIARYIKPLDGLEMTITMFIEPAVMYFVSKYLFRRKYG